jgi:hypothetical protein
MYNSCTIIALKSIVPVIQIEHMVLYGFLEKAKIIEVVVQMVVLATQQSSSHQLQVQPPRWRSPVPLNSSC